MTNYHKPLKRTKKTIPQCHTQRDISQVNWGNRLIYDELNYDTNELKDSFNLLFQSLTCISIYIIIYYISDEQCKIFKTIMEAVNQEHERMFFLYGYG
ncbi:hypothetical protein Lal_00031496 [Lupinus albus]|nr:hypothetical protein Lal_00031496 [Lupinus albus]